MTCNRAKRDSDDTDFRESQKLVRDRFPEWMETQGKRAVVWKLSGRRLVEALKEKLVEETAEYLESGSAEELADILEVVRALIERSGSSMEALSKSAEEKRSVRGAYESGIFLERVEREK